MTSLVAFDGDNTLWTPLSGLNLSDRTPTDSTGNPDFVYTTVNGSTKTAERSDGARYELRPEAEDVLRELRSRGILAGVVSYNHEGNVRRILSAFGISGLIDYVVAEWHTDKDRMLKRMLDQVQAAGHRISPSDVLLVDDDPDSLYGPECLAMGVRFRQFGVDMLDLRDVLPLTGA